MKWSHLSLAVLACIQMQSLPLHAAPAPIQLDAGILPIQNPTGDEAGDTGVTPLPKVGIPKMPGQGQVGTTPVTPGVPVVPVVPGKSGNTIKVADVKPVFKCNLFENSDLMDVLSSVNSLNAAMGSPTCGGQDISNSGINENNKKLAEAVKMISTLAKTQVEVGQSDGADLGQTAGTSAAMAGQVDVAIQAASNLATIFASSDLLNEECRSRMNAGQIVLSLNNIINGLTPYALMVASATGGTAAVPFIVGGSIATNILSSLDKILSGKDVKIENAQVRAAILENTCQFIRVEQRYKFLIKSRDEQTQKISKEIKKMQKTFSANIQGLSVGTNSLVGRKNALSQASLYIEDRINRALPQLTLDKQYINGTSSQMRICSLGVELSIQDQGSYIHDLIGGLDAAQVATGTQQNAQANSLRKTANIAFSGLRSLSNQELSINMDYTACANATQYLIETAEDAGKLAKRLVRNAQMIVDKQLQGSSDYDLLQTQLTNLNQKQELAEKVVNSLDNLKQYATSFAQSEIAAEMDRMRLGLSKPVMAWFGYTQGLYRSSLSKFDSGVTSLLQRSMQMDGFGAAGMYNSGKRPANPYVFRNLTLEKMPKGTRAYNDACREMQLTWDRWVKTVDHLTAVDSLCGIIEPYVYDQRPEDRDMVMMCRGIASNASAPGFSSTIEIVKKNLSKSDSIKWATSLRSQIDALGCPVPTDIR